jgi:hypothetical protein
VEDETVGLLLVCEVPPVTEAAWFPAEARRVLRPTGALVFSHLNSRSYRALAYRAGYHLQSIWGGRRLKPYYYNGPTYATLREALVQLGFEIVREEGFCWFPFGRRSNSPLVSPAVRIESLLGLRKLATISPWVMSIARLRHRLPEDSGRKTEQNALHIKAQPDARNLPASGQNVTISDNLRSPSGDTAPHPEQTWCEEIARTAWGTYVTGVERRALLEASALAGPPGTALELGCDGGRWSMVLRDEGWSNICTDIVPESVRTCQGRLPTAKCILVNPSDTRLPVEDGSVRLLVVYEVPPVTEAAWFPAEARRVLQQNGILVFTHLNSHSYRAIAYRAVRRIQRFWKGERFKAHYDGPSYSSLRSTLVRLGFEMEREEGFCWFPFTRRSNSPLVRPAVRMESRLGLRKIPAISPWVVSIARSRRTAPGESGQNGLQATPYA